MNWGRIFRCITHPSYLLTMAASPAGQNDSSLTSGESGRHGVPMLKPKGHHSALEWARENFSQALSDVDNREAACLTMRIRYAHSLSALWHLRSDVFLLIALYHNEQEASARLKVLNQHFPQQSCGRFGLMSVPD